MGRLCLRSPPAINNAKACHRAALVVSLLNLPSKYRISERPLDGQFNHRPDFRRRRIGKPSNIHRSSSQRQLGGKTGTEYQVKFVVRHVSHGPLRRAGVCTPVRPLHCGFVIRLPLTKGNRSIKGEIAVDIGIEMVRPLRIGLNFGYPRHRKVGQPPASTENIRCRAPGFIIYNPVAHSLLNLIQIHSWEVISAFRQIVIARGDLRLKDAFQDTLPSPSKLGGLV